MLYVHRSERADRLVEILGDVLAEPLADPMSAEIVAVPTRGVERWLAQRLSHRLGTRRGRADGVCANVAFPFPGEPGQRRTGSRPRDAAGADPWRPERSVWPLLQLVDAHLDEPFLEPLAAHLRAASPPSPGLRRPADRGLEASPGPSPDLGAGPISAPAPISTPAPVGPRRRLRSGPAFRHGATPGRPVRPLRRASARDDQAWAGRPGRRRPRPASAGSAALAGRAVAPAPPAHRRGSPAERILAAAARLAESRAVARPAAAPVVVRPDPAAGQPPGGARGHRRLAGRAPLPAASLGGPVGQGVAGAAPARRRGCAGPTIPPRPCPPTRCCDPGAATPGRCSWCSPRHGAGRAASTGPVASAVAVAAPSHPGRHSSRPAAAGSGPGRRAGPRPLLR